MRWRDATLRLTFIVNRIKANDLTKKYMQLRMWRRVFRDFKQRLKHIWNRVSMIKWPSINILLRRVSNESTAPVPLWIAYRRGIWIIHRTWSENSPLSTTHAASLSHSLISLQSNMNMWYYAIDSIPSVNRDAIFCMLVLASLKFVEQFLNITWIIESMTYCIQVLVQQDIVLWCSYLFSRISHANDWCRMGYIWD